MLPNKSNKSFAIFYITAEYVKQCSKSDLKLKICLIEALHHLRPYLRIGIPDIELPSVEPFRVSENLFIILYLTHKIIVNVKTFVKYKHFCHTKTVRLTKY